MARTLVLVAQGDGAESALGRDDEASAIASVLCAVCNHHSDMQLAHLMLVANRLADGLQAPEETPDGLSVRGVGANWRRCAPAPTTAPAEAPTPASQLEFRKQHLRGNSDAALGALVCAGSDNEVASTVIVMLNDPLMRAAALGDLQTYDEKLSPFTTSLRARLTKIDSRPDVKASLDRVGGVSTCSDGSLRGRRLMPRRQPRAS